MSTDEIRIGLVGDPASIHLQVYWRFLQEQDYSVDVLGWGEPSIPDMRFINVEPTLRFRGLPLGLLTLLARQLSVCRALLRGRYDVVSLQFVTDYAVAAGLCRRGPLHMSFWGSDIHRFELQRRHVRTFVPLLLKKADAIQAVSEYMADQLIVLGAPSERIEVFQYGVDVELFKLPEDPLVRQAELIVSTRGLRDFYRIDVLLMAMAALGETHPGCQLVIAGDGPDERALRDLSDSLGIADRVRFVGVLDADELAVLLQRATVWASLPPTDGTPLSLLEAMACGAYPVVADYPSLREWIERDHGTLLREVAPSTVAAALADALDRAASGQHVPRNRAMIVERGNRATNLRRFEGTLLRLAGRAPE